MKKLKNNNNKIVSVVINNNQYDLIGGVASFQENDIAIARTLGFKEFEEAAPIVIKKEEIPEVLEAPSPAPIKKTKTKKSN